MAISIAGNTPTPPRGGCRARNDIQYPALRLTVVGGDTVTWRSLLCHPVPKFRAWRSKPLFSEARDVRRL